VLRKNFRPAKTERPQKTPLLVNSSRTIEQRREDGGQSEPVSRGRRTPRMIIIQGRLRMVVILFSSSPAMAVQQTPMSILGSFSKKRVGEGA
jgi:hypothetical protein